MTDHTAPADIPTVAPHAGDDHAGHDHGHPSGRAYLAVFLVLCVCTVLSVVADVLHLSNKFLLIGIVLAIATAKALSVMLYFMHLKFERGWKYLLLAPTLILAASLPLALAPDLSLHYYTPEVPQERLVETPADRDSAHPQGH